MKSLTRFAVRRPVLVLLAWIALFVGVSAISNSVGSAYSNSFNLPGTDSLKALKLIEVASPALKGEQDYIVFHATSGTLDQQRATISTMLNHVGTLPGVTSVVSPFCDTSNPLVPCLGAHLVAPSGKTAFAIVNFDKAGFQLPLSQIKAVVNTGSAIRSSSLQVEFNGNAIEQLAGPKGSPGEIFGFLAALIVLFLAFGSLFSMLLPVGVALFGLSIASGTTVLLSHSLSIAQFAPILGSLIGAGVGIDYALFIVTRTRQGLKRGLTYDEAIVTSMNTSGRAVLFAGATVCIALLGMTVLGLNYLVGVAVSASVTVAITVLASVTLLPSLLSFLKTRVLSRKERRVLAANGPELEITSGGWLRWSTFVAKRPVPLAIGAFAVMAALSIPYFSLHLGNADAGSDPASSTTHKAYVLLSDGFGPGFNGPIQVVAAYDAAQAGAVAKLDSQLQMTAGVRYVSLVPALPHQVDGKNVALFMVYQDYSPQDVRTNTLIDTIRHSILPSYHLDAHVGGSTAIFADFAQVFSSKIPLFIGVIVLLGCLLLMIAFRSVLVPLTAAAMNLLAAAASFGVVVAVFQWGWGSSLIGAGSGPVESFLPVIMIAILFGLSMDYQVFLVSRMHEEWVHTGDNKRSVSIGQASTGRVITAAALIMICVFLSFVFGGQRVIAEFGIGLGGAVLLDAFILRTILVPALMHLLGKANWWMPGWLDKVTPKLAIEVEED